MVNSKKFRFVGLSVREYKGKEYYGLTVLDPDDNATIRFSFSANANNKAMIDTLIACEMGDFITVGYRYYPARDAQNAWRLVPYNVEC